MQPFVFTSPSPTQTSTFLKATMKNIFDDIPAQADPSAGRKWSPQQEEVFHHIRTGGGNLIIQACAGSGKTTTIIAGMAHAGRRPLFLAFNKSVQLEIASRLPSGEAKTLNALGFAACRQNIPRAQLDTKKNSIHLKEAWKSIGLSEDQYREFGYSATRVLGVMKNLAVDTDFGDQSSVETILDIIEAYWFVFPEEYLDSIVLAIQAAYAYCLADTEMIDFDDQLLFPVKYGWALPQFTDVFVDECQDLSPIQHALISLLANKGSRIIAVGDRYQAIYGFRGAAHDSMDRMKLNFSMTELPLSTTYRCPQAVVQEAQRYCPTIFAREGAPIGSVHQAKVDPIYWDHGNMILCRNNAPLFRAIMRHVRDRREVQVLSNFLDQLAGFIKSFKANSIKEFLRKLEGWYEKERTEAEEKEAWGKLSGIEDRYETLCVLSENLSTTKELLDLLTALGAGKRGPLFSTIHKAKGLESPSVHLLRPDLLPSPFAFGESALRQEANLSYVGITRALDTFTYGEVKK